MAVAQSSAGRYMPERLLAPLTVFLGAFLLFAVEPLIAKMILPWFGGSAEVWIVCLLFFQVALLAGYLYAHLLTSRFDAGWQWRVHLALLAVSLVFLPIVPAEHWKPIGGEDPLPHILALLTSTIGLPFLLLASTGPLVQAWLSRSGREPSGGPHAVYRLYALSNVGSLLALILYPVLIEPWLATRVQAWSWSLLYCVFVLFSAAAAWTHRSAVTQADSPAAPDGLRPSPGARAVWFLLATAPSALLLAATHYMLLNIAAIPLFWVVPLALYLLSFIVAFDHPRWFYRPLWYLLFAVSAGSMIFVLGVFLTLSAGVQLAFFGSGLFICCMVCHGELAALKPPPRYLTSFYLIVASGGAAGGLFIAVIAPSLFNADFDLSLVLPALALLAIWVGWPHMPRGLTGWVRWNILLAILYVWGYVSGTMAVRVYRDVSGNLFTGRNFYGSLRVSLIPANQIYGEHLRLQNGNIIHGREFTAPERSCEPTSYYGRETGIGVALWELGQDGPLKVGVIGLGAGTIAGYGRFGDVYRFYEINPMARQLATTVFHYLACPAQSSVVIGDARLSLEREAPAAIRRACGRRVHQRRHPGTSADGGGLPALLAASETGRRPCRTCLEPLRRSSAHRRDCRAAKRKDRAAGRQQRRPSECGGRSHLGACHIARRFLRAAHGQEGHFHDAGQGHPALDRRLQQSVAAAEISLKRADLAFRQSEPAEAAKTAEHRKIATARIGRILRVIASAGRRWTRGRSGGRDLFQQGRAAWRFLWRQAGNFQNQLAPHRAREISESLGRQSRKSRGRR